MVGERTDTRLVHVTLEDRVDGGLHVYSRDIRGLHLSGRDPQRVWEQIGPAIKHLLERNDGVRVERVFYPHTTPEGENPKDVGFEIHHHAREETFALQYA